MGAIRFGLACMAGFVAVSFFVAGAVVWSRGAPVHEFIAFWAFAIAGVGQVMELLRDKGRVE